MTPLRLSEKPPPLGGGGSQPNSGPTVDLADPARTAGERRHRFDAVAAATKELLAQTPKENFMTVPTAESLPFASIVAKPNAAVWVKEEESSVTTRPWTATHYHGAISDADVDEVLQSGEATVLRVGEGR